MPSATLSATTVGRDGEHDVREVRLSLTVRNDGTGPLTLRFRTGQRAEFTVE